MSRTKRRTKPDALHHKKWAVDSIEQLINEPSRRNYPRIYHGCTPQQIHDRQNAAFHSCDRNYGWNAPAWYRRDCNRSLRHTQKMQLIMSLQTYEEEDLLLDPFKKDAAWMYF